MSKKMFLGNVSKDADEDYVKVLVPGADEIEFIEEATDSDGKPDPNSKEVYGSISMPDDYNDRI